MIIGISGFIGSGKGTVATTLTEQYGFKKDSFAASLKDACASIFDWPRDMLEGETKESREWREQVDVWWSEKLSMPNLTPRLALQLMGTDVMRNHFNESIWFLTMENRIRKNPHQNVVISDVRFPNEIKFIQDIGGTMVRVNRGATPVWYETAILANKGNSLAKSAMGSMYSDAHFSEWAWVGVDFNYEINNDSTFENINSQIKGIIDDISRQHKEST
jgi:hypothetical protein